MINWNKIDGINNLPPENEDVLVFLKDCPFFNICIGFYFFYFDYTKGTFRIVWNLKNLQGIYEKKDDSIDIEYWMDIPNLLE